MNLDENKKTFLNFIYLRNMNRKIYIENMKISNIKMRINYILN